MPHSAYLEAGRRMAGKGRRDYRRERREEADGEMAKGGQERRSEPSCTERQTKTEGGSAVGEDHVAGPRPTRRGHGTAPLRRTPSAHRLCALIGYKCDGTRASSCAHGADDGAGTLLAFCLVDRFCFSPHEAASRLLTCSKCAYSRHRGCPGA